MRETPSLLANTTFSSSYATVLPWRRNSLSIYRKFRTEVVEAQFFLYCECKRYTYRIMYCLFVCLRIACVRVCFIYSLFVYIVVGQVITVSKKIRSPNIFLMLFTHIFNQKCQELYNLLIFFICNRFVCTLSKLFIYVKLH